MSTNKEKMDALNKTYTNELHNPAVYIGYGHCESCGRSHGMFFYKKDNAPTPKMISCPPIEKYQGLEFGNCYIEDLETKGSLWQRIKHWFFVKKLKKNGWEIWRSK